MFQQIINNIKAFRHYKYDQQGIINRFLAEEENWKEHLFKCKKCILESLPNEKVASVAILGSGWLLDVPVDELMEKTDNLILVDINHPRQIVNKYKNNPKITFVKADLTNNLVQRLKISKTYNEFLSYLESIKPLDFLNQYSQVVSLNLLNQLDILLCDLLMKKFILKEENIVSVREKIQSAHLRSLPKGNSLIITDYEEINYLVSIDDFSSKNLIYTDLSEVNVLNEWLWKFDTHQTYRKNYYTTFKVLAGNY